MKAGIPDFRSSEGLFQTLKKDHPTLGSGKDLFDASVFNVSLQCTYSNTRERPEYSRITCPLYSFRDCVAPCAPR